MAEEDMWVVAVAMAMAPWITVSELRRDPDCGVDGASSKESRLPPAAELATAAVGPCRKASKSISLVNSILLISVPKQEVTQIRMYI